MTVPAADVFAGAPCHGHSDLYYPPAPNTSRRGRNTSDWRKVCAEALALCATCPPPTRVACRDETIRMGDYNAPRGGLTPPELQALARQKGRGTR